MKVICKGKSYASGTVWRENTRGKTEVVRTLRRKHDRYWEKNAEDGTARKEETGEGLKGGLWMPLQRKWQWL